MKSINFELLRNNCPELADLAGFAEQYVYQDPSGCLVKLRSFIERMIKRIYTKAGLPRPYQPNLMDLIKNDAFRAMVPLVVLDKFHSIRIHGNKAAHGDPQTKEKSLWLLKEAFDLACWFHIAIESGSKKDCPAYQEITLPDTEDAEKSATALRRDLLEKLAAQEARLQELLLELEAKQAAIQIAAQKPEDLQTLTTAGKQAADVLSFNEETTRKRLIDSMLADAGWDFDADWKKAGVVREEEVPYQPTQTGIGYADYELKDDNDKPLAVIEAKRTAVDPNTGRKQAQLYADGLEKKYAQRPVIFYTNGFEHWIWDDSQNYPPRQIQGFYSKDSLQYLIQQRRTKVALDTLSPRLEIIDRLYQLEAVKRVSERFGNGYRKALLVQATGTGKTRVAIALTDLLIRAGWVKRVLFLCDRKELRKQAKNVFNDYINEPLTIVRAGTAKDRARRIYLATYPAMMKIFETFDVGFFDLIIADESHRSIYNRYRDLFIYFDCLQIGLTATPVEFVARNTYRLFDCEDKRPTAYYSYEQAVAPGEDYLVPYEVFTHTTAFLRSGIKYSQLTDAQKQQLEEDGEDPETFDYDATDVDRQIFNRDTNRAILRNLMGNGLRDATGQRPGKSIIFARNHKHAILLSELFDEMYPQYGGSFCQVIDNYDPRAEQLIDDFKGYGNNKDLAIAISVDMLDTGIDVPEIVNLVFAKPIKSKVKFWQMIGRGTRLCKDLFGAGKDKTKFRIFDHWGNFEYFEENKPEAEPALTKSLMQKLFEARIDLAELALTKHEIEAHKQTVTLIGQDLNSLPEKTIAVRERWKEKRSVSRPEVLEQFSPATVSVLRNDMAPLMQWINLDGPADAFAFDLLVTQMQTELLHESGRFADLKDKCLSWISELILHLNPVKERAATLKMVKSSDFWNSVSVAKLEEVRKELRGIMHHRQKDTTASLPPKIIDVADGDIELVHRKTNIREIDASVYKKQVEEALRSLFHENVTLQKIRAGQPVTEDDLKALCSLVLTQHPGVDLETLREFYDVPVERLIRSLIGMETGLVKKQFAEFVQRYPKLTANQTLFLNLLQNHIAKYGSVELERLYEPPFTSINSNGLDGAFTDEKQVSDLLAIIKTFQLPGNKETESA